MFDTVIFCLSFYLLLFSVIGFGIFFQYLCFGHIKSMMGHEVVYTGFYGLFLLTLISLLTSLILPHNFPHNVLLHSIGICKISPSNL